MLRITAVLMAFGVLNAQSIGDQEAARARLLLQSPDWAEKAWGAYFAGRLHSDGLRAPLVEQIHAAASLTAPREFVSVLLDAAIELQLELHTAEIEPFQSGWPEASLILLARAPDGDEALLRLADAKWFSLPWLAANNLLYQKKSPAWYRKMLGELNVTHRFTVTDPGSGSGCGGSSMCGVGGGRPGVPAMKGFPPIARYALGLRAVLGSAVLADGPHAVYYVRTISEMERAAGSDFLEVAGVREGYLAALADLPEKEVHARMNRETTIIYRSADDFRRTAEGALQLQEQQVRELILEIDTRGLRAPSDLRLRISVAVSDLRQSPPEALPAIGEREIAVNR